MRNLIAIAVAALLVLALPSSALAGDDAEAYRSVLEQKAQSIVTVKLVLKTKISFMGQSQDQERNLEVPGAVVDASGLVMIAADPLNPGGQLGMMDQLDVKATPTSLKVIFEDDEEEYDAILGAKDTNLNLAFVQIKDLGGREVSPVDFANNSGADVGEELVGVTRFQKGFDYAAHFGTIRLTGQVALPRPLWSVEGSFRGVGLPLFNTSGSVVGVLATQEGSEGAQEGGDGGGMGMLFSLMDAGGSSLFVLPAETVRATIEQAKKQAQKALEKQAGEGEEK